MLLTGKIVALGIFFFCFVVSLPKRPSHRLPRPRILIRELMDDICDRLGGFSCERLVDALHAVLSRHRLNPVLWAFQANERNALVKPVFRSRHIDEPLSKGN